MSNRFKISLEENVATEGTKGAIIGFLIGSVPGAIIGHFWQEYLIEKEKKEKAISEKIAANRSNLTKPGVKQKNELLEFEQKKLKEEIKEVKVKVKEEEANNKKITAAKEKQKKVSKEELAEEVPEETTVEEVPEEVTEVTPDTEVETQIEEKEEEVELQEELVEGLESLKFIATKIGTPSATEVALFRVAANMAVAGTKQSAQTFLPAMESKKPIDTKGFDDKIKEIQKKIAVLNLELSSLKAKKKIG